MIAGAGGIDLDVEAADEGEGDCCLEEVLDGGGGGVFGSGRLEAIWNSWSSSAGSGDVVEDAAVPFLPTSPGLSPLTNPGMDPGLSLLVWK